MRRFDRWTGIPHEVDSGKTLLLRRLKKPPHSIDAVRPAAGGLRLGCGEHFTGGPSLQLEQDRWECVSSSWLRGWLRLGMIDDIF